MLYSNVCIVIVVITVIIIVILLLLVRVIIVTITIVIAISVTVTTRTIASLGRRGARKTRDPFSLTGRGTVYHNVLIITAAHTWPPHLRRATRRY